MICGCLVMQCEVLPEYLFIGVIAGIHTVPHASRQFFKIIKEDVLIPGSLP
jgi:hypothetical protein